MRQTLHASSNQAEAEQMMLLWTAYVVSPATTVTSEYSPVWYMRFNVASARYDWEDVGRCRCGCSIARWNDVGVCVEPGSLTWMSPGDAMGDIAVWAKLLDDMEGVEGLPKRNEPLALFFDILSA